MSRNTNLKEVLFPVQLIPVFYETRQPDSSQLSLFEKDTKSQFKPVARYQALMNSETEYIFCVVSEDYRLVTNQQALEWGKQIFKQLFNTVDLDQLEVFKVITSRSRSFCHIDLIHKGYEVNIWKSETWLPFLRVTNSYNRRRPLRFDLGFVRKICDNGCIFEQESIQVKYLHTKNQLVPARITSDDYSRLQELERSFVHYAESLRNFEVPKDKAIPLACRILKLHYDLWTQDEKRRSQEWTKFDKFNYCAEEKVKNYYETFGSNGYAMLNVITDLSSHPAFLQNEAWMIDSYEKRAGEWLRSFSKEIVQPGFSLNDYLKDILEWFPK